MNPNRLHNKHQGETCVIIGNGPSLANVSNESLAAFPSFGTNRIYLKNFIPTYYVAVNPLVLSQFYTDIAAMQCDKFVSIPIEGAHILRSMKTPLFSYNPLDWVYEGHTVTFVAMQLAFFMGFQEVRLVGVDHKYQFIGEPNERHTLKGSDPNHFHADYFSNKEWHNPDLQRSEHAYGLAKKAFEDVGRRIVNCTPESALEVFPREEWI